MGRSFQIEAGVARAMRVTLALLCALILTAPAAGHASELSGASRQVQGSGADPLAGYPLAADPTARFADFQSREDLAAAGELAGATRVMRFMQVTDMQLVDDDAPYPMRQGILDELFGATISGGAERPQEEYGDEILSSMVQVIDRLHAMDPFDFQIHTGDNIDNALENELMRYLDIMEGTHSTRGPVSGFECLPDGQSESVDDDENDVVAQCTSLPEHLVGQPRGTAAALPWFAVYGNHDALIQGNVAIEPEFQEIAAQFGRHFLYPDEFVRMHFAGDPCAGGTSADDFGHGYGFAGDRLCDDDPSNDAYYTFDLRGVHFIVLDTVNDKAADNNQNSGALPGADERGRRGASGLSEGALDAQQWQWLQDQLAGNQQSVVVVFAHHTINAFYNDQFDEFCGPPGCLNDVFGQAGFVGRDDVHWLLSQYPNVVAFMGGHTHAHRVTPSTLAGAPSPGYWNIESSGLLDLPQESRIVELWVTARGNKAFLALDPVGHMFATALDAAAADQQHDAQAAAGGPGDRRVLLWFDIPAGLGFAGGQQPSPTVAPELSIRLVQPTPADPILLSPGNTTWTVTVEDAASGAPIGGLDVVALQPDALPIEARTPLASTTTGTYQGNLSFPDSGEATVRIEARGAAYGPATLVVAVVIEGEENGAETPLPALGLLLVTLIVAARHSSRAQAPAIKPLPPGEMN